MSLEPTGMGVTYGELRVVERPWSEAGETWGSTP